MEILAALDYLDIDRILGIMNYINDSGDIPEGLRRFIFILLPKGQV